ncbi:hypothetical protein D3C87_351390 [compost metagenome]
MRQYQSGVFLQIRDLVVESIVRNPELWSLVKKNDIADDILVHESGVTVSVYYGSVSMDGKNYVPLDQGDMEEIAMVAGLFANKNKMFRATRDVILSVEKSLVQYKNKSDLL